MGIMVYSLLCMGKAGFISSTEGLNQKPPEALRQP